jgi:hypothetical protein
VTACSASADAFTAVKVHTAKCSECDKRNMDTMQRCPGCTFQLCKPCCDRRLKAGRALTHGNMLTPAAATPGAQSASVQRRRLGSVVVREGVEGRKDEGDKSTSSPVKLKLILKSPTGTKRVGRQRAKPRESGAEESEEEYTPYSPTIHKRRRIVPPSSSMAARLPAASSMPQSAELTDDRAAVTAAEAAIREDTRRLTLDELMQQHGVNTPENPYQEHLLSRYTPVTTNPAVYTPPNFQPSFKPRPTAADIQQNIQDKVRQKLEAEEVFNPCAACCEYATDSDQAKSVQTVRSFIEDQAMTYLQFVLLDKDEQDEFVSALKEVARKWAVNTYNGMAMAGHTGLVRGLDMCLNTIGPESRADLENVVAGCAARKLRELARESGSGQDVSQMIA